VAEHALDGLDVGAGRDGQAGGCVPELVLGQVGETGGMVVVVSETAMVTVR